MTDEIPIRPRGVRTTTPEGHDHLHVSMPLSGRDAWLAERRTGYGATDVPVLVSGDNKAWNELHARKLGLIPEQDDSETMELGRLLEEPIARLIASRLGVQLVRVGTPDRPKIIRHPELPFVLATLDRREKRGGRPVEIKKWGWQSDDFGPEGSDIVPERMFYQVQQQLAVTGKPDARLGVLFAGSKLVMYRIGRDDGTIDDLLALETEQWAYVARGEIPPWPGPAPERAQIRHDEIEPDEELIAIVQELDQIGHELDVWTHRDKGVREMLRQRLDEVGGTRGELPDGRRFSIAHRQNKDGTRTDWKLVAAGYRQRLLELGVPESEIDPISTALTVPRPGDRPLRVTISEPKA
jgi:predicted phage-related endonuclease